MADREGKFAYIRKPTWHFTLRMQNLKPTNRPYVHRGSSDEHRDGPETIDFVLDPENDEGCYSLDCETHLAEDDEAPPPQDLDDEW